MKRLLTASAIVAVLFISGAPLIASAQFDTCAKYNSDGSCADASGNIIRSASDQKALAAGAGSVNVTYIKGYADSIVGIINGLLVPVLISIAFIVFLYGVYKYFILGAASDDDRKTGRQFVLWGIIGFVVIFTVWGLVNLVGSTLNLTTGTSAPKPPKL